MSRCYCETAPIAVSDASVIVLMGALGLGWTRSVVSAKVSIICVKAEAAVDVHSLLKISPNYWCADISNSKYPAKHTPESQVQCKRVGAKSRDGGPVDCSKARAFLFVLPLHRRGGMQLTLAPVSIRKR